MRKALRRIAMVATLVAATVALGVGTAQAEHNFCHNDDNPPADDVWIDTGFLFVGVDHNPDPFVGVCVQNESYLMRVDDADPGAGTTVSIWHCTDNVQANCTRLVRQTGAELGTITPVIDPPGGGSTGVTVVFEGTCVWIDDQKECL